MTALEISDATLLLVNAVAGMTRRTPTEVAEQGVREYAMGALKAVLAMDKPAPEPTPAPAAPKSPAPRRKRRKGRNWQCPLCGVRYAGQGRLPHLAACCYAHGKTYEQAWDLCVEQGSENVTEKGLELRLAGVYHTKRAK